MARTAKHPAGTTTAKGAGLARGPALILGLLLSAIGLALFLHAGDTPTGRFPDGDATGSKVLGLESNGWTAYFTTVAGVLLLFGAAQHLLAKTMSLIVGVALIAAALLDLLNGPGVLGLAAANPPVDIGWGVAGIVLLVNVLLPRVKHGRDDHHAAAPVGASAERPTAANPARAPSAPAAPVRDEDHARTEAAHPVAGPATLAVDRSRDPAAVAPWPPRGDEQTDGQHGSQPLDR